MSTSKRPLYIHVGCRKSGTSFLQSALLESRDALAAQGVGLPLGSRFEQLRRIHQPVASFEANGPVPPRVHEDLSGLAATVRDTAGTRMLLTLEDLAQLDQRPTELLVQALDEFEVHLIITARHWARQIPSEWQQCVKERLLMPYPDFARAVRDGVGPDAELFRTRQHVPDIADRWGASLPPGRVHVVAVPSASAEPERLAELFCDIIDVDPGSLTPAGGRNPSLAYQQAETLRRINVALGDRLGDFRTEYRAAVRKYIARGVLLSQDGSSLRLPTELVGWCHEESANQVKQLVDRGYDLVGALDDLVSPARADEPEFREVTEAEVAEVAVAALADLAVKRHRETQQAAAEQQNRSRKKRSTPTPSTPARRSLLRRVQNKMRG